MTQIEEAKRMLSGREWYYFTELSSNAQQAVLDRHELFPDWYAQTIDELERMLEDVGVRGAEVGFSGFYSQGDGAHFTGSYSYRKGALAKYKRIWPNDHALHCVLEELQEVQRRGFYKLETVITHRGFYKHEMCAMFDGHYLLIAPLRKLMRYCYKYLEWEYEYQKGDGAKEYYLEGGEQFNEDGSVYYG